jgi:hypothetical protein
MGCMQKEKPILIYSKIKKNENISIKIIPPEIIQKNKILHKISQNNWLKILNFLSFSDLKELGKVNRIFNYYVKQKEILVKFFRRTKSTCTDNSSIKKYQNRNSDFNKKTLQNFLSFSVLQNNTNNIIDNDDSIINNTGHKVSSFKKTFNI